MAKLADIRTSLDLELGGVELTYRGTDLKVTIARLGNPNFETESRKLRKDAALTSKAIGEGLSDRESKDALAPAIARYIIKGWSGLQDDDGKDIPYSFEEALKLLRNPALHDFYDWVMAQSSRQDNFREAVIKDIEGNS